MVGYKEKILSMDPKQINSEVVKEMAKAAKIQLSPFFNPSSIALVGASRKKNSVGWVIFKTLIDNVRAGILKAKVYGVNVKGGELFGEPLYRSLSEIRGMIEHVIIAVPAKFVPQIVDEAGRKGAKVVTIISSGFSEVGNVELEQQVLETARKYDIRIIGPNGLGVLDLYTGVDTLFIPKYKEVDEGKLMLSTPRPPKGFITFLSQSGALGAAVLDYMYGEKMGLSKFISAGNKIDVDEIDILLYSLEDPTTRVIMMYIEGVKSRGDVLVKVGKYIAREKPIVVLKGGRTSAGARAAASHTASIAGNERIYRAAFHEMGAIFTDDLTQFLDTAKALAFQPPAAGNNIAIVTNGGGAGILAADRAEKAGLKVLPLPDRVMSELKEYVRDGTITPIATFANPVDLSGIATVEAYLATIETLLEEPTIQGLVIIAIHQTPNLIARAPEKIARIVNRYKKPVTVVDIGGAEMALWTRSEFDKYGLPSYPTPERAVCALRSLVEYGVWLTKEGLFEKYIESWERPKLELPPQIAVAATTPRTHA